MKKKSYQTLDNVNFVPLDYHLGKAHPLGMSGFCTFLIHESIFITRIGMSVRAYLGNSPCSSSILRDRKSVV